MVRMYAFLKMIFTFLFLLIVFVRLMSAACECQKTENIDLIAMLTGCENCFQCIQRLMATETDPIRIVIIRYKVTETRNNVFFSLPKSGLEQLISALLHHKRVITAKKQQLEFPTSISIPPIMTDGELYLCSCSIINKFFPSPHRTLTVKCHVVVR